jgi:hypothetical protein
MPTFFFFSNVKIDFKNNHHMLFFSRDVITACKTKLLILFTSLMNIEYIKAFLVDMDVFNVIKKINFIFYVFWKLPKLLEDQKNFLVRHNFFPKVQ